MEGFDSDWDSIFAQDKVYSADEIPALAAVQAYFARLLSRLQGRASLPAVN